MTYSELANWDGSLSKTFQQRHRRGPSSTTASNHSRLNKPKAQKTFNTGTPSSSSSVQVVDDLLAEESTEQLPATSTLSVSRSLANELFPEAKISPINGESEFPNHSNPPHPTPTPPTPPPDPVVPAKRKRKTPVRKESNKSVEADSILAEGFCTRRRDSHRQSRNFGLRNEPFINLPSFASLNHSRDIYRSLAHWFAEGRCQEFFCDTAEVVVKRASSSTKCKQSTPVDTRASVKEEAGHIESIAEEAGAEEPPSEAESYLELVALDALCHHCRRKNRYAKMKCTNILRGRQVCTMEFCHLCIYQRYPDIEFEPFSRNFVCPRCQDACNCNLCCLKRNEPYFKTPKRNRPPANLLYLSELGRRQQEAEQRKSDKRKGKAKGKGDDRPTPKSGSTRRRENSFSGKPEIGSEAQEWMSSRLEEFAASSSRVQLPRIFVGEWSEGWGTMANDPPSASMMCVDVPGESSSSVNPAGKGKGRAIEPHARVYVGDRDSLHKTFISIDEVEVEETEKKTQRARKPSAKLRGDDAAADPPKKKRGRKPKNAQGPVPEFTINHQEFESTIEISNAFHNLQHDNSYSMWADDTHDELNSGFDWERNEVLLPPVSPWKGVDNKVSFDEQYRIAFEEYNMLPSSPHKGALVQHGFDANVYNLEKPSHFNDFNYAHGLRPSSIDPTLGHVPDAIDPVFFPLPFPSPKGSNNDISSPSPIPLTLNPAFLTGPTDVTIPIPVDPHLRDESSPCPSSSSPKSVALSLSQVEYAIRNAFQAALH